MKIRTYILVVSTKYLEQGAFIDGEDGHIEGPTAEVKDKHVALSLEVFVEAVCERCSGRLVDNTKDIHARDSSRIL